jgi:hypothetical protein
MVKKTAETAAKASREIIEEAGGSKRIAKKGPFKSEMRTPFKGELTAR